MDGECTMMEDIRNPQMILVSKPLMGPLLFGRIILKVCLKVGLKLWIGLACLRIGYGVNLRFSMEPELTGIRDFASYL